MMLMELFAPQGALTEEQRLQVSEWLVAAVFQAEHAPAELLARGRALTQVMIHESAALVGGRPVDPTSPPRFVVRVSVPAGHNTDATRAELVKRVTRVLADIDDDPQRLYREPHAWVQIIEVPDGNMGTLGQVVRIGDIMRLVIDPEAAPAASGPATGTVATAIDPICGMAVALTDATITLVQDGETHAFCCTACRDLFATQRGIATS